jgi:hypothetical protein
MLDESGLRNIIIAVYGSSDIEFREIPPEFKACLATATWEDGSLVS